MSIFGSALTSFTGNRGASTLNSNSLNVPAGALIICGVTVGSPSGAVAPSVSDGTNTYDPGTLRGPTGFANSQQWFYCLSAAANAALVIEASNTSAANWLTLAVWVVPLSGTAVFDVEAGFGAGSGGTCTSATFNTAGSDEFCACLIDDGGFGTGGWSANGGWSTDTASFGTFDAACSTTFASPQTGITGSMSNGHSSAGSAIAIGFSASGGGGGGGGSAAQPVVCVMQ